MNKTDELIQLHEPVSRPAACYSLHFVKKKNKSLTRKEHHNNQVF